MLTFLMVVVSLNVWSQVNVEQQIDSLRIAIANTNDKSNLTEKYNELAVLYGESAIDSTVKYAHRALINAEKYKQKLAVAEAHLTIGRAFIEKSRITEAIEHYQEAILYFEQIKDEKKLLSAYRAISYAYSYSPSQLTSLTYYMKAIDIAEELNDTVSISVVYNNLAATYKRMGDINNSLFYFEKALELDKLLADTLNMAISYSNLAVVKSDNNLFTEAKADIDSLHFLLPSISNNYLRTYFNLAFVGYYAGIAQFDSAKLFIDTASALCEKYGYEHIKTRLYRKQGEYYFARGNYNESISYLNKCVELSEQLEIAEDFTRLYNFMARAYEKLGNYQEAYRAKQMESDYIGFSKNKDIAASLARFENERRLKQELENQRLEQELLTQKAENRSLLMASRFRLTLISSILLLIIGIVFVYYTFNMRHKNKALKEQHAIINKQNKQLEQNLEEISISELKLQKSDAAKNKLFSIIAHDLRSPFNGILGFSNELSSNYDNYSDAERKSMADMISSSSKSTFSLLNNLLNWARTQSDSIKLSKETIAAHELIEESINAIKGNAMLKSVTIENDINTALQIYGDSETLKVIVSNLVNNAIKFSHENGKINIKSKQANGFAEILVQDFGIGIKPELLKQLFTLNNNTQRPGTAQEKGTGLGLIVCKEFAELNGGMMQVSSTENEGSVFSFTVPLAKG
ncbi:tetratricopeptide repeat-containing sensor histidine kinase [uncultured Draconibacterium sp.]|uniref:ATP-binding protein n=1 Tax=uncultured Draconibacterium sp. TaxID=1573823 RepID=UPI00326182C7